MDTTGFNEVHGMSAADFNGACNELERTHDRLCAFARGLGYRVEMYPIVGHSWESFDGTGILCVSAVSSAPRRWVEYYVQSGYTVKWLARELCRRMDALDGITENRG